MTVMTTARAQSEKWPAGGRETESSAQVVSEPSKSRLAILWSTASDYLRRREEQDGGIKVKRSAQNAIEQ